MNQLQAQLASIPVYLTCNECAHFGRSNNFCVKYTMTVPAEVVMLGCDNAIEDDIPF